MPPGLITEKSYFNVARRNTGRRRNTSAQKGASQGWREKAKDHRRKKIQSGGVQHYHLRTPGVKGEKRDFRGKKKEGGNEKRNREGI